MFERLRELCIENGIAVTDLCKQITGSSGNLPTWKKGNIKADTLVKIADYFHVSIDYLLGRTDEPNNNNIQTGDISNTIQGDNNNNVNIGNAKNVAGETLQEIGTILSELTPRQRTELMMIIYQFADEHTV